MRKTCNNVIIECSLNSFISDLYLPRYLSTIGVNEIPEEEDGIDNIPSLINGNDDDDNDDDDEWYDER